MKAADRRAIPASVVRQIADLVAKRTDVERVLAAALPYALECSGAEASAAQCVDAVRKGGQITQMGLFSSRASCP